MQKQLYSEKLPLDPHRATGLESHTELINTVHTHTHTEAVRHGAGAHPLAHPRWLPFTDRRRRDLAAIFENYNLILGSLKSHCFLNSHV